VLLANSGQDALEVLQRTPDLKLILSDMAMPEMNGMQLGRKAQELIPGIKVILSSGYADAAMSKEIDSLEGFYFLPKPYRMGDLVKMLRALG
jgi:DNA-binding NtrC family response regulator